MGEFDLDALVVDTVRRQTGNASAGPKSRFAEELRLSENGRKTLFAFLVEAFSARGLNLPARGFYQSNFLALSTVGELQNAVREVLGHAKRPPAPAGPRVAPKEEKERAKTTVAKGSSKAKTKARGAALKGKGRTRKRPPSR